MALDLFGSEVPDPENLEDGFLTFWSFYPPGQRRVAKPQCLKKWVMLKLARESRHIIAHVRYMKTQKEWVQGFHPMVLTYLNQRRWEDWEYFEQKEPPKVDPVLKKLAEDAKLAAPVPDHIRAQLASLRRPKLDALKIEGGNRP